MSIDIVRFVTCYVIINAFNKKYSSCCMVGIFCTVKEKHWLKREPVKGLSNSLTQSVTD